MKNFEDLEYKIGNIEFEREDEVLKNGILRGKFIVAVGADDKTLSLYLIDQRIPHKMVAEHFGLVPYVYKGHWPSREGDPSQVGNIVGGGSIGLEKGTLELSGRSDSYGAIPQEVAEKLLSLIALEIKKSGKDITGLRAYPEFRTYHPGNHNAFWGGNFGVLVVDIQNDFCDNNGLFAQQGLNVKPAQEVTHRIKAFIDEIRKYYYVPVIYTRQIESQEVSPADLKRQFASGKLVNVCAPNSWGSELYQLKPAGSGEPTGNEEYVIEKYTYDAFSNPLLNQILNEKGVDTLVITGVNTDICIDTTIRRAFTEGYNVLVPRELVATMNVDGEKYFLDVFDKFFGDVVSSNEVFELFRK